MTTPAIDDELFELLLLAFPPDEWGDWRETHINRNDHNASDVLIEDWLIAAIIRKMNAEIERRKVTES